MKYEAIEIGDDTWIRCQIGEPILAPGFEVGKLYEEIQLEFVDQYRHLHCDWIDGKPEFEIANVGYLYRHIARLRSFRLPMFTMDGRHVPYPEHRGWVSRKEIEDIIDKYSDKNVMYFHPSQIISDLKHLLE